MLGRRSIWSQPEVIKLAGEFVVATDEVWRLQNGDDPECRHFQKIADQGHYRDHRSTRQGIYVCTPAGELLGSLNTHNVQAVLEMMRDSLQRYQELEPARRGLPADAAIRPRHRWENSFPADGLDLTMFARDLPESCAADDDKQPDWNQDRIWFSKQEARQFLPADPATWQEGAEYPLPGALVSRITRFSIVDTVRGQTSFYARSEVAESKIVATISGVRSGEVLIRFEGTTQAESGKSRGRDMPHGIRTRLLGTAVWDTGQERFSRFEMVALGSRRGRTVFNGRSDQLAESPVGFVFQLTPEGAPLIAPSFLFAYRAGWVRRP